MKVDKLFREYVEQLNTSNLALFLPDMFKDFPEGRAVDLYVSLSHSLFTKKVEKAKMTGFMIEKNGNFRF